MVAQVEDAARRGARQRRAQLALALRVCTQHARGAQLTARSSPRAPDPLTATPILL